MKKFFILAIPVIAMTACTSTEDVKVPTNVDKEIGFTAVNHTISRNALVNNDTDNATFSTDNDMYVSALYAPTGADKKVFFEDALFSYNTSKSMWTGNKRYFYPYDGTLKFMAYSTAIPVEETADPSSTSNRKPAVWSYATDKSEFTKVEIDFNKALNGAEDVLYSADVLTQDAAGTIPSSQAFAFNHALALLTFKVKASDADAAKMITVKDIKVNGAALSGKLTVEKNASSVWSASWTNPTNNEQPISVPGVEGTGVALPATPVADPASADFGTGILVVDQTPTSFTVTYDMKVGETTYAGLTKTVNFAKSPISKWEAGKKYVYTIILSPKEITFTGSINKWANGGSENESIQ